MFWLYGNLHGDQLNIMVESTLTLTDTDITKENKRERLIAAVAKTDKLAHKKRYAYQKTLQSIRRIHENDRQNKGT